MSDRLTMATPPFARTACACPADIEHCSRPGYLVPDDLERIWRTLHLRGDTDPQRFFEASRGAVVANTATGQRFRIGTIVPKIERDQCVFLDCHRRCTIHEVAPFGCAFFDVHMEWLERQRRTAWGLRSILESVAYKDTREVLIARDGGAREPLYHVAHQGG